MQAGISKHVLDQRPYGADDASFGPALQASLHLAMLPLLRIGPFVTYERSSIGPDISRDLVSFGARAKILAPWHPARVPWWVFAGIGYTVAHAGGYSRSILHPTGVGLQTNPVDVTVESAGGGYIGFPLGIGASYTIIPHLDAFAELGATLGFGHSGSLYESPGTHFTAPGISDYIEPSGSDRVAVALTLGVMLDR